MMSGEAREVAVLRKCRYFQTIGAWPSQERLNAKSWLNNFDYIDRPLAVELLDAFVHYNPAQFNHVFRFSLSLLRNRVRAQGKDWNQFASDLIVTYPPGENPNPSDSGHIFVRNARGAGIPEGRLVEPAQALSQYLTKGSPVLFVDDFLGSGSQMRHTWLREYEIDGNLASFATASGGHAGNIYYCCAFATTQGITHLQDEGITVDVQPAHQLNQKDGVLSSNTRLLDPSQREQIQEMIKRVSIKAGFMDTGGKNVSDWSGFAGLGLALSFDHGTPDASLPILYKEFNGWKPLIGKP